MSYYEVVNTKTKSTPILHKHMECTYIVRALKADPNRKIVTHAVRDGDARVCDNCQRLDKR